MNLKVLEIENTKILRNSNNQKEFLDNRIINEENFRNKKFYVFSLYVKSDTHSYGVGDNNGNINSLNKELEVENKHLLKCRFIVIDIHKNLVYYDGNLHDTKVILKELFSVDYKNIKVEINPNDFSLIKKITVKSLKKGQMAITDIENETETPDFFEEIVENNGDISSITYQIELKKEGSFFNKKKLAKIVEESKTGLIRVYIEGFDENGNEIKLSSQISRKISILENESSWEDRIKIDLERVYKAILEA